jgi:hypothetical protein
MLESELDYWLYLFKNISQLNGGGTPFQKVRNVRIRKSRLDQRTGRG